MSLQSKFFIFFILLGLVPMLLIGIFSFISNTTRLTNATKTHLITIADLQEERVNSIISGYIKDSQQVAEDTHLSTELSEASDVSIVDAQNRIKETISNVSNNVSSIVSISVLDIEGRMIVSTEDYIYGEEYLISELIPVGLSSVNVVDIFKDDNNILRVRALGPIIVNKKTIGIVEIILTSGLIISVTEDYSGLGETGEVLLAKKNSNGDALFISPLRFDAGAALNRAIPKETRDIPINQALLGKEEALINGDYFDYRGERVFAVTRHIEVMDWGLVAKIDKSEALSEVVSFQGTFLLIVLFTLFVILFLSLLVSNTLASPLTLLTLKAKALEKGDFSTRVKTERKDEIGALSQSFNSMAGRLEELYRNLEQKVSEKTTELEETLKRTMSQNVELEKTKKAMTNLVEDLNKEKNKLQLQIFETKRFQQAVEAATDGVIITDPDQKIIYCNKACERIGGYTQNETLGKNVNRLLVGENTPKEVVENIQKNISKGIIYHTDDLIIDRKNGTTVQVGLSVYPIKENNKAIFFVGLLQDITKRKSIEQMKTEFVSIASHQLRTPLTAIKLFVEMLLKGQAGKLEPKQTEYLNDVSFSTERMIKLVNDLLNVSRLETGRLKIEPEPTNVSEFINEIVQDSKPLCEPNKCSIDFENTLKITTKVDIDQTLFRQTIHNFITNAIFYSKNGGKIVVRLDQDDKKGEYIISVKDNGIGIPESSKEQIFQKFYRADNAQKARAGGSGLGMYVAKMVVGAYGGRIWFDSTEDQGSTFYVTIPVVGMRSKEGKKGLSS